MKKNQLIRSTSGIRGIVGAGLDPVTVTAYGAAFGTFLRGGKVVLGRDTRPSGEMIRGAVVSGLVSVGIDVVDIGVVPTPTVEIAVRALRADGGICVTASHNPAAWNALKFFNRSGEFITASQYRRLDTIFQSGRFAYEPVGKLGRMETRDGWIEEHVKRTLSKVPIARSAVMRAGFKVVVDAVNGAGSVALPALLEKLGVTVIRVNCDSSGRFVREPEPIPEHLTRLCRQVKRHKADLGMACDPDADRLVLVDEHGRAVSEESTLTIAVQEILQRKRGATVVNLSTSQVTADVAEALGSRVYRSKVGEANVIALMRRKRAIIGGEGNGGVIYPAFHAGRDSLVAAALVLSALAREGKSLSNLLEHFPKYDIIKTKAPLPGNFDSKLSRFEKEIWKLLGKTTIDRRDGLRFDFEQGWLQLRKSNTEPIYRLIVETTSDKLTRDLRRKTLTFFRQ
jgi:phosphomannomutase